MAVGGIAVTAKFATMDEYIASFPPDVQPALQEVRRTIRAAAPGTEETISYGIPTFRLDGRYLVYFAGWKHHIAMYPVPTVDADLEKELAPYRAAKSALHFPLGKPIPHALIERLIELQMRARGA